MAGKNWIPISGVTWPVVFMPDSLLSDWFPDHHTRKLHPAPVVTPWITEPWEATPPALAELLPHFLKQHEADRLPHSP